MKTFVKCSKCENMGQVSGLSNHPKDWFKMNLQVFPPGMTWSNINPTIALCPGCASELGLSDLEAVKQQEPIALVDALRDFIAEEVQVYMENR